jgi:hypothetical protein
MKTHDIVENAIVIPTSNLKKDHPDHEVSMARSDLYRSAKAAIELHALLKKVSEEQGIEGWVAAKITKAADYLDSVMHYLQYEIDGPGAELDEQLPGTTTTAASPGVAAPGGTVVQANPQMAAAAAAKAAQQRKKALQDAIRQKQKELSDLQRQLSAPVTVSETATVAEEFKNTYSVGDKVSTPQGPGKIVAVSKNVNVDGRVKVRLDKEGEAYTYKTTDLKHLEEMASAGASAAGGVATAMGGNGFVNGGPGTLKRVKKTTKEAAPNQLKGTDKPKKMQKPGVIDQPHPFKGKLVGGD